MLRTRLTGFSLAELLIALAIMGVLMTFTVPALIGSANSNLSGKQSAMAKDVAYMLVSAYEQYRQANPTVSTNTTGGALTPYMNFVKTDTSSVIDTHPNDGGNVSRTCSATQMCLKLHNGGILMLNQESFAGTATTNTIQFTFDPNASALSSGTADGPNKAVQFELYYDGTVRTRGNAKSGTAHSMSGGFSACSCDPAWFTGF